MRRQDGLTLLEMLIVVGVTALLVTAGVQAHLGIRRAQARAAQGLQRERAARVFLDRFERELVGTILFGKPKNTSRLAHPYLFYGVHGAESDRLLDGLRVITRSPARAYPGSESPGLRL
ncbi:MAG: type II secretion system protein, partial [Myxococcota bacterium]